MHLSQDAWDIAFAIRRREGPDARYTGPDIRALLALEGVNDKSPLAIKHALEELESCGAIRLDRGFGDPIPGVPGELRGIVGVAITPRLQEWLAEAES